MAPPNNELSAVSGARERLSRFDLSPTEVHLILQEAEAAWRNLFSSLAPRVAPGIARWARTVEVLRDIMAEKGWEPWRNGGMEGVVNRERRLVIVPMTGDQGTGVANCTARNRYPKGIHSEAVVIDNRRQAVFPFAGEGDPEALQLLEVWFLLFARVQGELRCEVSLPTRMNQKVVVEWKERILLPSVALDDDSGDDELEDPGGDYSVEIARRGS